MLYNDIYEYPAITCYKLLVRFAIMAQTKTERMTLCLFLCFGGRESLPKESKSQQVVDVAEDQKEGSQKNNSNPENLVLLTLRSSTYCSDVTVHCVSVHRDITVGCGYMCHIEKIQKIHPCY